MFKYRSYNEFNPDDTNGCRIEPNDKEDNMLYYTIVFLVIAVVAALLGFTGIAAGAASIAKILFVIFLILFVASLVMHLFRRSPA